MRNVIVILLVGLMAITSCGYRLVKAEDVDHDIELIETRTEKQVCYYWEDLIKTKNFIGKTICVYGMVDKVIVDRMLSVIVFNNNTNNFGIKAWGDYSGKVDYCISGDIYIDSINTGQAMPIRDENTMVDCPIGLVEKVIEHE